MSNLAIFLIYLLIVSHLNRHSVSKENLIQSQLAVPLMPTIKTEI